MATTTDYSKLTADELLAAEAKVKKQRIIWAFVIGGFIGILLWAVLFHASLVKIVLLVVLFGFLGSGGKKNEDNFNAIKSELRRRNI
ncbi:hypothetical protein [Arsenicibacter rosenii]|uniref:DUF2273 domain-containing protein n=1 Tax=Arsenicibacter rosenii TaxID=1750698 RepID=A0A1S2VG53_9BACT|nr:hypothetical protein [Arsenicibacter rosenii]OIN57400.1 hypothetical protein BLX24_19390 [Arsenicibacter rosenii]